ncbi:MAG TPA: hypothetical protein DDY14_04595 [Chromatiaceae bacterium]|nr:MAG: hypothetical protein N838_03665 [Thiohalocapsa sp. PB-PSB1]HBG94604.1 hypothetical protein [Chromatiaceae bacterium]HCS91163.1 hypothetical protein [Chromatiaceae bacterium]
MPDEKTSQAVYFSIKIASVGWLPTIPRIGFFTESSYCPRVSFFWPVGWAKKVQASLLLL